ncbi:MAG: nucleotidyltransferase family protein [Alphaproteobacteria bacterium]
MSRGTHPRRAMVLAAGLGVRMREAVSDRPKPLVEVQGRTLLDRALDRMAEAGVELAVVNVHYLAAMIEKVLAHRVRPGIVVSREETLLETGGGVAQALPSLGAEPFYVANSDALWLDGATPALRRLAAAWDDETMDALLLLVTRERAGGFEGPGDFFRAEDGRLARRGSATQAPYVYGGVQLVHPRLFAVAPRGAYSFNILWDRALADGRLAGLVHDGAWFHVGSAAGLAAANRALAPAASA